MIKPELGPEVPIAGTTKDVLQNLLSEILGLLSNSVQLKYHFKGEIEWLSERRYRWKTQAWTVGLIGITSSGKSTLINALLRSKYLPASVRPTSNRLVRCRFGEEKAVVHFLNGTKKEYTGTRIKEQIYFLTDEYTNKKNYKKIKEIDLYAPNFMFGESVTLVDTPGLDAYGHEDHEQLTINMFLPTVDAVMFLTTVKANMDGEIAKYIDCIGSHEKPLIIVQNMIDSIEGKLGGRNSPSKSRKVVAHEHLVRMRRLLSERPKISSRTVPIIQVSAKLALEAELTLGTAKADLYQESNISAIVSTLEVELDHLKPSLLRNRLGQICKYITELCASESNIKATASNQPESSNKELQRLRHCKQTIDELEPMLERDLNNIFEMAKASLPHFLVRANSLEDDDINKAERLKSDCEAARRSNSTNIVKVLNLADQIISRIAKQLNLTDEDYLLDRPSFSADSKVIISTDTICHTIKKNKKGLLAKMQRAVDFFNSGWGTEDSTEYKTKLNKRNTIASIKFEISSHLKWLDKVRVRILTTNSTKVERIGKELASKEASTKHRLESEIEAVERAHVIVQLETLLIRMSDIHSGMNESMNQSSKDDITPIDDKPLVTEIQEFTLKILEYASLVEMQRCQAMRDKAIARAGSAKQNANLRILLMGYDTHSMENYLSRFWSDKVTSELDSGSNYQKLVDIAPFHEFAISMMSESENGLRADYANINEFLVKPATVFLLIDIAQPGAMLSQLKRAKLKEMLNGIPLIIVPQNLKGVDVGQALVELRINLQKLKLRPLTVMANDTDEILTACIDRLFTEMPRFETLQDQMEYQRLLGPINEEQAENIGGILRLWSSS